MSMSRPSRSLEVGTSTSSANLRHLALPQGGSNVNNPSNHHRRGSLDKLFDLAGYLGPPPLPISVPRTFRITFRAQPINTNRDAYQSAEVGRPTLFGATPSAWRPASPSNSLLQARVAAATVCDLLQVRNLCEGGETFYTSFQ